MTAIPRPTGKAAHTLDTILSWLSWATQVAALALYMGVIALSPAWGQMWSGDAFTVVCLWGMGIGMGALWMISLREERHTFHDQQAHRDQRKTSRLGHLCVLLVAVVAASAYRSRLGLWFAIGLGALYAHTIWAAWTHSRIQLAANQAAPTSVPTVPEPVHTPTPALVPAWQIPDRKHTPLVYFIRNGNRLKIGTTTDLKRRIRTLALRPENVVLLLDGGQPLERALHRQFTHLRVGNTEWFAYDAPLIAFVTEQNRLARKEQAK